MMGAKQRSYVYQINSYKALNIANAGMEYVIRYASGGLDGSGNSIFFTDPTLTTLGRNFGGGSFTINYNYTSNQLTSTGTYSGTSRTVRLSNFRRYISPITLIPDPLNPLNRPRISIKDTIVPIISNNENTFTVSYLEVTVPISNAYLDILRDGTSVFEYSVSSYPVCDSTPVATCKDATNGIYLGTGVIRFDLREPSNPSLYLRHSSDTTYTYTLRFSAPAPIGQYILQFYTNLPSGNPFKIQFTL